MSTTNKNSRIVSRVDRTGKIRTETVRRDYATLDVAISTDARNNSTRVFFDVLGREASDGEPDLELNGHEARTLYLALHKHYSVLDAAGI